MENKSKIIEKLLMLKFKIFNGMFFRKKNKIILDKNNNYNNLKVKFSNNYISANKDKHIQIMSEQIKNFLIVMERECENFNSDVLLSNIEETFFNLSMIKEDEKNLFNGNVQTTVLPNGETLATTFTIDNFSTTNHELLHLSTILGLISGFKKVNRDGTVIGVGINEGYTQFLAERYFNENKGESYIYAVLFSGILENIVGKNKMEKYYFQRSIISLVGELEKYETYENIVNFIKNMDFLIKNGIDKNPSPTIEYIQNYQSVINQICKFLLSCSKTKVDVVLEENPNIDFKMFEKTLLFDSFYHTATTFFPEGKDIKEYTTKLFDEQKVLELFDYARNKFNETKKKMI